MSRLPVLHHAGPLPSARLGGESPTTVAVAAPPNLRRRLVLAMAAFTMAIEILAIAGLVPDVRIGSIDLSLSIVPALGLAVACGERLLGRSTWRPAAVFYWVAVAGILPVLAVRYAQTGRLGLWTGLLAASVGEELVYRLAIPAVIALVLRAGKVRPDWARMSGLALAGLWFVLLPGHREQMHSVAAAVPFVAFALLSAVLVYRSGSVLPMAAGHAITNMLTVLVWRESVGADARSMGLACVLGLLVVAYGKPRRLTVTASGGLLDTRTGLDVTLIDLRDDHHASVTLSDGSTLDVDGHLAAIDHVNDHA